MRQKNKVRTVLAPDLRKVWKDEAAEEIQNLHDDIGIMDLPDEKIKEVRELINKFQERLNDTISLFEVTTEIGIDNEDLLGNMLNELYYERATANEDEINRMIDITSEKGVFIKIESLAERIKVEAFIEELTENPYQLKLIA